MGRYLIAISYALCILVIGQMLKGCTTERRERNTELYERTLAICIEKGGVPIVDDYGGYGWPVVTKCSFPCDKKWGEPG